MIRECVDVLSTLCCANGDPLSKRLLRFIEKDESQTLCNQCAEKVSLPADCWRWRGRWPRKLQGNSSPSRRTTPPSAQGLHAPLSADGGWHSDKRPVRRPAQIPSHRCPMQLSTGRRSPRTATSRGRPPQRRNDHDPRIPRRQAAAYLIQSAAVSTCCPFWFTERGTCAGSQCR